MGKEEIHPLVSDTDALLALGNSEYWELIANNVGITTTHACQSELFNHKRRGRNTYQGGARRARLASSAEKVLDSLSSDSSTISCKYLGRCRNGEHSIAKLAKEFPQKIEGILMMDSGEHDELELGGRKQVKAHIDIDDHGITFPSPAFPFAVLYLEELITKDEFCQEADRMIRVEDWTSYAAVKRMWAEIPVDCGGYIPSEHLP